MSNPIHRFSPFRIIATVPRSILVPHGGAVVSYNIHKSNLSFETVDLFRHVGHQEGTNNHTYAHSVLLLFDQDRDPRLLHALNALSCAVPSVAARLNAIYESGARL